MDYRQTFTIDLRDLYGEKLDKLAAKSDKQFARIEKGIGGLSKAGKQASRSIDDINKRIDLLKKRINLSVDYSSIKAANKEMQALVKERNRLEGLGTSGGMGSMARNLVLGGGLLASTLAAKNTIAQASKAYMNYEATKTSFGVLAGDNQVGEALANRLNKFQQDTILGPEVFKSAQTLMAFGVTAREVEKDIQQLGAVSMGNVDRFQALTLAFAQTRSAGKLMGQDLLQYVNAGFNPLQTISEKWKEFGFTSKKSVGDLRKEMEKGTITADMVAKAFEMATGKGGKFDGMLDKIGKTSFGIWQQLSGQVEGLEIAAGERFKDTISGTGMLLSALIGKVKSWVEIPLDEKLKREADNLRILKSELNEANISSDRRKDILKEINEHYGQYLKGLDLEKASYQDINKALNNTIDLLDKKSQRAFLDKVVETSQNDLADLFTRKTAIVRGIREVALKNGAQDLLNRNDLDESDLVQLISHRFNKKDEQSQEYPLNPEDYALFTNYADVVKRISKQTVDLAKTKQDVEKQMQQAGLFGIDNSDALSGTNTGGGNKGSAGGLDTAGINSVNSGSSVKNIYISIGNLMNGDVIMQTTTLKESVSKAKDMIIDGLLTAVNDANLAGGNQ